MSFKLYTFTACIVSGFLFFPLLASSAYRINPDLLLYTSALKTDLETEKETNRRNEGRTLFSFPEWYIVYSAKEYAEFVADGKNPSDFPYLDAMNQFWESAYKVKIAAKNSYILNEETKTVLNTIGISFSVENILTAFYESTMGRASYSLNLFKKSPEDKFNDQVAREYAEFLNQTPWYEFPYFKKYLELWTKAYGINSLSIRGLERRAILSTSYLFKGIYGAIIKKLARANYNEAALETKFVVKKISLDNLQKIPDITIVRTLDTGDIEAKTTRYRAFRNTALKIIDAGGELVSIENNSNVLVSIVAEKENECLKNRDDIVFSMPVLTQEPLERVALLSHVHQLHILKTELERCGVTIEHLYDY